MTTSSAIRKATFNQARHEAHLAARKALLQVAARPHTPLDLHGLRDLLRPNLVSLDTFPKEYHTIGAMPGRTRGMQDVIRTACTFMSDGRLLLTPERVVDIYWSLPTVSVALVIGCLSGKLHAAVEALAQFEYHLRPAEYAPFYQPDNIPLPVKPLVDYAYHLRATEGMYHAAIVSHSNCTQADERAKQYAVLASRLLRIGFRVTRFHINDDRLTYAKIEPLPEELSVACMAA